MKDVSGVNWIELRAAVDMVAKGANRVDMDFGSVYSVGAVLRIDLKVPSKSWISGDAKHPYDDDVPF